MTNCSILNTYIGIVKQTLVWKATAQIIIKTVPFIVLQSLSLIYTSYLHLYHIRIFFLHLFFFHHHYVKDALWKFQGIWDWIYIFHLLRITLVSSMFGPKIHKYVILFHFLDVGLYLFFIRHLLIGKFFRLY